MTKHIAVGGTFDLFHKGHKDFLKKAFGLSDRITVGVTSDKLSQSLGKSPIDPFQTRLNNVRSYIKINSNKVKVIVEMPPLKNIKEIGRLIGRL